MLIEKSVPKVLWLELYDVSQFPEHFSARYHTHLLCRAGAIDFVFKGEPMSCGSGQFLFWFAESALSQLAATKNFRATALLVEKDFLNDNVPDQSWSINALLHSRAYPVKQPEVRDRKRILENFRLLYHRHQESGHLFYSEMCNLQMRLFILEMWDIFAKEYEKRKHQLQNGSLYERFMQLVPEHCMSEREVRFYANKLNITPKYLNEICKMNSGVTASGWIQRYAKERIILLLQNKTRNIAEVADEMHFNSRSFFTRYVKKILGVTPKEYRERLG